ncbi:acyltransferase [Salinibacterium amurskyense]|uniref:acyltransferase family protein n=1 Tax=Salinibacterium amurskyense TaxID=205941 RepID=UPI00311DCD84
MPPVDALRRLDTLTGLRWWAAFGVFLFHIPNIINLPGQVFLRLGDFGVSFFFALSGFVLTYAARRGTSKATFYWRRFARIWPVHVVALIIAIPVFYSAAPDPEQWWVKPFGWGLIILSVFLLQGWSRDPEVLFAGNPPAWSLTSEAFFYALHPFFNPIVRELNKRRTIIAGAALLAVTFGIQLGQLLLPPEVLGSVPLPILRLNEFVLGMLLARAIQLGFRLRFSNVLLFSGTAVFLLAVGALDIASSSSELAEALGTFAPAAMTTIFIVIIATVVSNELAGKKSHLSSRALIALGDMSFAFYLVHSTLIYAVRNTLGHQGELSLTTLWVVPTMLVGSIALSAVLHYGVERPVERRLREFGNRRQAAKDARTNAAALSH